MAWGWPGIPIKSKVLAYNLSKSVLDLEYKIVALSWHSNKSSNTEFSG